MLSLNACANKTVYQEEIISLKPSNVLLEPLEIPSFQGTTNEDLLLYALGLEKQVQICNERLTSIAHLLE